MATIYETTDSRKQLANFHKFSGYSRKMPVSSPAQQQNVANQLLKQAMTDERSKRWAKVVQNYRRLLRMLNHENLPHDFDPPSWFRMFLYECHYHLGLALQNIGENKRAVAQYTRALEAIFIPKNGCTAGCHTNSCLMVPLYTRRAFANANAGELKAALLDAEKAVVLDCKNPDVYCIRALVRSTCKEDKMALADAETALKHNPKHLCALILRGTLAQPLFTDEWGNVNKGFNKDHNDACSINPDCHNYLSVHDFNHPEILSFYDRFLYSLNVPHTISEVDLVSIIPEHSKSHYRAHSVTSSISGTRPTTAASQRSCSTAATTTRSAAPTERSHQSGRHCAPSPIPGRNGEDSEIYSAKLRVTSNPMKFMQETLWNRQNGLQPFRCGMQRNYNKAQQVCKRRKEYGIAVQEYVNRPKTAQDYMRYLEKEREKRRVEQERVKRRAQTALSGARPQTAMSVRSLAGSEVPSNTCKVENVSDNLRTHLTFDGSPKKTKTTQTVITTQPAATITTAPQPTATHTAAKKIKVFQDVNVSDAPRMYYRPWFGDKLPVAEIEKREVISPPFKP